jgi:hypothetical protein
MKIVKTDSWKFHKPIFEYEAMYDDLGGPWAGHKYFAYDLIRNYEPKKVVELGTHLGCSLFTFAQAVKDANLSTELDAIDTWQGDEHAGTYNEIIFTRVNEIKEEYYKKVKINLVRTTFDKASSEYKNSSIDILHIDGLHTYQAVKHDFNMWIDKVKEDGIVLFHDISVKDKGFGVFKLWDELKKDFGSLEFNHSFGLGVLFKDSKMAHAIKSKQNIFTIYYPLVFERENQRWRAEKAEMFVNKYEKFVNLVKLSPVYFFWKLFKKLKTV